MVDTGSTTTIMSEGCYNLLKGIPLNPTNTGYMGVTNGREQYKGIIPDLRIQLADDVETTLNVAVVPNPSVFFLVGNDLIGGNYARFTRLGMNDAHGNMLLQDSAGAHHVIPFVRNREFQEMNVARVQIAEVPAEPEDEVYKLFRR